MNNILPQEKKENLLLIFTRNPEFGKCKTRLAATVGKQTALDIYKFLLDHTVAITKNATATKEVHYSVAIRENDIWNGSIYNKKLQRGHDLGTRMAYAFSASLEVYKKVIIIGSDMYDLNTADIDDAFNFLDRHDYVLGPAEDGGYYLLGMKVFNKKLFTNKKWGTETVLKDTLDNLKNDNIKLLKTKNDVDFYEDIKDIGAFQPFLKNIKHDK